MRLGHTTWLAVLLGLLPVDLVLPSPAGPATGPMEAHGAEQGDIDSTIKSAIYQLRSSMRQTKDGSHGGMLRTLRQWRDPELAPLFERLIESDKSTLQVHGMLGRAACDPSYQIDLAALASLKDSLTQFVVVTSAMDAGMLDPDGATQLMGWSDLSPQLHLALATYLHRNQVEHDLDRLRQLLDSPKMSHRAMVALLLLQAGDNQALAELEALNQADQEGRGAVLRGVLDTAFRGQMDRIAPWAMQVAANAEHDRGIRRLAMVVALRFDAPGAAKMWYDEFKVTNDSADTLRLATMALSVAHWSSSELFRPMLAHDDPQVRLIGQAAIAVASGEGVVDALVEMIAMNRLRISQWVVNYAKNWADDEVAPGIWYALIKAFDGTPARQQQRYVMAVTASRWLADRYPDQAVKLLRPVLTNPQSNSRLVSGILLGVVQCQNVNIFSALNDIEPTGDTKVDGLLLLIAARSGRALTDEELRHLALIVRGGGQFAPNLRLHAAWAYLKYTDQTNLALAVALDD